MVCFPHAPGRDDKPLFAVSKESGTTSVQKLLVNGTDILAATDRADALARRVSDLEQQLVNAQKNATDRADALEKRVSYLETQILSMITRIAAVESRTPAPTPVLPSWKFSLKVVNTTSSNVETIVSCAPGKVVRWALFF